jgi:hypothetical protein
MPEICGEAIPAISELQQIHKSLPFFARRAFVLRLDEDTGPFEKRAGALRFGFKCSTGITSRACKREVKNSAFEFQRSDCSSTGRLGRWPDAGPIRALLTAIHLPSRRRSLKPTAVPK